jgi:hypothetical protein
MKRCKTCDGYVSRIMVACAEYNVNLKLQLGRKWAGHMRVHQPKPR